MVEVDGRAEAYALYRLHFSFEDGVSTGVTNVIEAMGTSPEATREIWRFLLDIDWMASVRAVSISEGLWLRLVDVEAALGARSFGEGERVVLEVTDSFCPWNEGRYEVPGGDRTEAEPDLRVDVTTLGSVYLGGFTFRQMLSSGSVIETRARAAWEADALFRTEVEPWCPEIF